MDRVRTQIRLLKTVFYEDMPPEQKKLTVPTADFFMS